MPEWTFLRMRWDAIFSLYWCTLRLQPKRPLSIVHREREREFNLNAKIKLSLRHIRTMFILLSEWMHASYLFGHSKCCFVYIVNVSYMCLLQRLLQSHIEQTQKRFFCFYVNCNVYLCKHFNSIQFHLFSMSLSYGKKEWRLWSIGKMCAQWVETRDRLFVFNIEPRRWFQDAQMVFHCDDGDGKMIGNWTIFIEATAKANAKWKCANIIHRIFNMYTFVLFARLRLILADRFLVHSPCWYAFFLLFFNRIGIDCCGINIFVSRNEKKIGNLILLLLLFCSTLVSHQIISDWKCKK